MIIEINKDIDKFQETVVLGLTARQLIYSVASVVVGGSIVLLLYKFIGLTGAAYIAIPCVAPIALGGFYSFNGMNFYEYMGRRIHFMFGNRPLLYKSTEGEAELRRYMLEAEARNKKSKKSNKRGIFQDNRVIEKFENEEMLPEAEKLMEKKDKEDFEAMKIKTKKLCIVTAVCMVLAAIAAVIVRKYI